MSRSRDRTRRHAAYLRRPREFYSLWIAATTTYGVGDIVSTIAFLEYVPAVDEANPVVAGALDAFGLAGLVGLKIAVYLVMLWLSGHGARAGGGACPAPCLQQALRGRSRRLPGLPRPLLPAEPKARS